MLELFAASAAGDEVAACSASSDGSLPFSSPDDLQWPNRETRGGTFEPLPLPPLILFDLKRWPVAVLMVIGGKAHCSCQYLIKVASGQPRFKLFQQSNVANVERIGRIREWFGGWGTKVESLCDPAGTLDVLETRVRTRLRKCTVSNCALQNVSKNKAARVSLLINFWPQRTLASALLEHCLHCLVQIVLHVLDSLNSIMFTHQLVIERWPGPTSEHGLKSCVAAIY